MSIKVRDAEARSRIEKVLAEDAIRKGKEVCQDEINERCRKVQEKVDKERNR